MGEILDAKKTDLELSQFATLSAIKGRQFGKDVYSSLIKFNDLDEFLQVFPSVQRNIVPRKVNSIKRYVLSGLKGEREQSMRFFSAVTVTCKSTIYYDDKNNRCAIDTHDAKLSINDGQHRFEAIRQLIIKLEHDFLKAKDSEKVAELKRMIEELKEMVVPVVIFDDLSESEEKQLFHDLNNLSQRPSRNANIRLNQTDLFSKMARELAESNRYLTHYGVEMDKMSISGNNKNTILLSTLYESTKELLGFDKRYADLILNDDNYNSVKEYVNEIFDKLFFVLPSDINERGKYMIDKNFTVIAISRFINHVKENEELGIKEEEMFKIIQDTDWTYTLKNWSKYGGVKASNGNIVFGGGSAAGFKAVYSKLMDVAHKTKVNERKDSKKKVASK